eukprot:m.238597 g.238597  ORF g.238597 m.238597 type:complete len:131 (+) comp13325_c0_seq1:309-701(+)
MHKAATLRALGVKDFTKTAVEVIASEPSLFYAHNVGGYVFQSTRKPYLFLYNDHHFSFDDKLSDSNKVALLLKMDIPRELRVGLVNVTEMRRYHNRDKSSFTIGKASLLDHAGSAAICILVLSGLMKAFL